MMKEEAEMSTGKWSISKNWCREVIHFRHRSQPPYRYRHPSRRARSANRSRRRAEAREGSRPWDERQRHRSASPARGELRVAVGSDYHGGYDGLHSPARTVSPMLPMSPDPNMLPGQLSASQQEIFALYQTRDALNHVVAQL